MKQIRWIALLLAMILFVSGCHQESMQQVEQTTQNRQTDEESVGGDESEEVVPYRYLNENQPDFTKKEKNSKKSFEKYSKLDSLGRCQAAFANIGQDLMPTEERQSIGAVKPSGWHTVKYDNVDGKYLYNRCHLIGYQLSGENANRRNLITGTRYMNTEGMLPFENQIADYVRNTDNHVLYRVTPTYDGDDLVAKGVQMEAYSIEDKGQGICFNVFVYNIQPGIEIDYTTGDSQEETEDDASSSQKAESKEVSYVLNTNTKKFHEPTCASVSETLPKNRKTYTGTRENLINQGYEPCGRCHP